MTADVVVALRRLAGEDCRALPRPGLWVYDDLARRGLARVIDTGDSVGWAITEAGRAALRTHRPGHEPKENA